MKQRIISAAVGLVILAAVLAFFNTPILNAVVAVVAAIGVNELLHAADCTKYRALTVICTLTAIAVPTAVPVLHAHTAASAYAVICCAFAVALFLTMIAQHERIHIEKAAFAFMATVTVPFSAYMIIYIRDMYKNTSAGIFYIIMALGAAWFSDSGAYFVGRAFGKHKMSPKISPHKTVEGAVGGVVICTVLMLLSGLLYENIAHLFGDSVTVNYFSILIAAPITSVAGILGDLSAPLIKRQYGVKDYGKIMPGHGGVMDRFDSVLMVLPIMTIIIYFLPFVQVA